MAGRVSLSLLNSLVRGNVIFRSKKCLRKSVVLISRFNARSVSSSSSSSISAAQPDLSSHLAGKTYADLYDLSVRDPKTFWGSIAKERLAWTKPFDQVTDCDLSSGKINWFLGGQLNVSVNCLDVHVAKDPDRVALIWEKDEPGTEERITYSSIHVHVTFLLPRVNRKLKDIDAH
uniref:Acyl-CoA synthetase short chain family member 1 n=1 Tax=Cyprinus carpio TaxID=7962 RepID=A0A8C2DY73_CYPCA